MKLKIIIIIWIVLWINFIARDLYTRGYLNEYKILARSDYEEKHAQVYGKRFYEFLKFAKDIIPPNERYDFVGINNFSLDGRRGIYYLYPRLKKEKADYLLVYGVQGFRKDGFRVHAKLDKTRIILKRD